MHDPTTPARENKQAKQTPPSGAVRVLIVDDYPDLRTLLRTRLEMEPSYVVVGEAVDGEQAIALARELQPDLVLLDLAMPRIDGLQALPHILAAAPGVRVVAFTGFKYDTAGQQALAAGAHGYILKGTGLRDVIATLNDVMAR